MTAEEYIEENAHSHSVYEDTISILVAKKAIKMAKEEVKEQLTKDALDGLYIHRNRYTKKNVLHGFDVTCDAIQRFKKGDKVKLIIIKED